MNLLTTERLAFATVPAGEPEAHAAFIDGVFDPAVSFEGLELVREAWGGPLLLKGIQTVEDARRAADHGADVAAAVGLGAKACLVGRPYLDGLIAGGEEGVDTMIEIFASELRRTMKLLGASSVDDITPSMVRLRTR
ncbi:hypothetical protein GCM10023215_20040 [Pseudonocardia yuanmonensis]|uniref:FMN-dependent dehydrogenase domain-containing protein n=2 Tax=Pseudonocardia yuanmonensis TaxID=1095914 RepID=A0ABP8WAY6_9PSEU